MADHVDAETIPFAHLAIQAEQSAENDSSVSRFARVT